MKLRKIKVSKHREETNEMSEFYNKEYLKLGIDYYDETTQRHSGYTSLCLTIKEATELRDKLTKKLKEIK